VRLEDVAPPVEALGGAAVALCAGTGVKAVPAAADVGDVGDVGENRTLYPPGVQKPYLVSARRPKTAYLVSARRPKTVSYVRQAPAGGPYDRFLGPDVGDVAAVAAVAAKTVLISGRWALCARGSVAPWAPFPPWPRRQPINSNWAEGEPPNRAGRWPLGVGVTNPTRPRYPH
jgi:hypothetical protein